MPPGVQGGQHTDTHWASGGHCDPFLAGTKGKAAQVKQDQHRGLGGMGKIGGRCLGADGGWVVSGSMG